MWTVIRLKFTPLHLKPHFVKGQWVHRQTNENRVTSWVSPCGLSHTTKATMTSHIYQHKVIITWILVVLQWILMHHSKYLIYLKKSTHKSDPDNHFYNGKYLYVNALLKWNIRMLTFQMISNNISSFTRNAWKILHHYVKYRRVVITSHPIHSMIFHNNIQYCQHKFSLCALMISYKAWYI